MKKLNWIAVLVCMLLVCTLPVSAADATAPPKIVDGADCLSESEETELSQRAEAIAGQFQMDVVIVTALERQEADAQAEADALFDQGGYGIGEGKDGILLLVNLGQGEWSISTHGSAIAIFTDSGIQRMGEQLAGTYLSDAQYAAGFQAYLQDVENILTDAADHQDNTVPAPDTEHSSQQGTAQDTQNETAPQVQKESKTEPEKPKTPFNYILPALIGGFILTALYMSSMKQDMKTAGKQKNADTYFSSGNAADIKEKEIFLTSSITKKRIDKEHPEDNRKDYERERDRKERERRERERRERARAANRGKSTTHVSKSGEKHGGGSGKF